MDRGKWSENKIRDRFGGFLWSSPSTFLWFSPSTGLPICLRPGGTFPFVWLGHSTHSGFCWRTPLKNNCTVRKRNLKVGDGQRCVSVMVPWRLNSGQTRLRNRKTLLSFPLCSAGRFGGNTGRGDAAGGMGQGWFRILFPPIREGSRRA